MNSHESFQQVIEFDKETIQAIVFDRFVFWKANLLNHFDNLIRRTEEYFVSENTGSSLLLMQNHGTKEYQLLLEILLLFYRTDLFVIQVVTQFLQVFNRVQYLRQISNCDFRFVLKTYPLISEFSDNM